MNKLVCTTVLAAGLAFFGTGAEEAHAGNSAFFLSVGGPRGGLSYSSGFRSAFAGGGFGGGRGYGWDRGYGGGYYGRRVPVTYARPIPRQSFYDGYRRDAYRRDSYRRPCDRGGYYGY